MIDPRIKTLIHVTYGVGIGILLSAGQHLIRCLTEDWPEEHVGGMVLNSIMAIACIVLAYGVNRHIESEERKELLQVPGKDWRGSR